MGYYLIDHKNPNGEHFYRSRRGSILAIVVHITAGLEDLDTVDDHSAEKTAAYAAGTERAVSWHSGSDSDSVVELLPAGFTAWHASDYNSRTLGHEISKHSPDWRDSPVEWIDATIWRAGYYLGAKARSLGIPIRHATKAELDRAIALNGPPVGFVSHGDLDPDRRRDPGFIARPPSGDTFPWSKFLGACNPALPTPPPAPAPLTEEDVILFPSFVDPRPNGRRAFYELRPVDGESFIVVSFNDAPLDGPPGGDGTTPSGQWYRHHHGTTGRALGIGEHRGAAVVACANGGTYTVSPS